MDRLTRDLRYALRTLRSAPAFTAVAILSIAIGIGANTTVFSLVNAIFFAPLPFRDGDRLFDIYEHNPGEVCAGCGVGTSYALYQDLRASARTLGALGAYSDQQFVLSDEGAPQRVRGAAVSAGLLELLGFVPHTGRLIQAADDRVGAPRVALIAESLWRARYEADPSVVGRALRLNGDLHTIVGILPGAARFPNHAQFWVPLAPLFPELERGERTIGVIGRRAHDVGVAALRAELSAFGQSVARQFPQSNAGWSLHAVSLRSDLAGEIPSFGALLGVVVFVLLVACANLAGLLLARGAGRRKEVGMRLALGAEPAHVVRLMLTESLLIAFLGAGLGLLLSWWSLDLIAGLAGHALPVAGDVQIDWRVLAFTATLALATGVAFGLAPALEAARVDVAAFVKEGGQGATLGVRATRLRRILVAGEIAAAMLLLTGAGLTTKVFLRARTSDAGHDTRHLLRGDVRLFGSRYAQDAPRMRAIDDMLDRVARLPSVRHAAAHNMVILNWPEADDRGLQIEGVTDEQANAAVQRVTTITPDYFATLGLSMMAGRAFRPDDAAGAPLVAVVNQALATRLWPDHSALGMRIRIGRSDRAHWRTVVGVVANVNPSPLARDRTSPQLYLPLAQRPQPMPAEQPTTLHIRTDGNDAGMAQQVTRVLSEVDAQLLLESFESVDRFNAAWASPLRAIALLMSGLTAVALGLALMGVYGITLYSVHRRRREIGIRMALGASARDAARLVLGEGFPIAAIGLGIGLLAALALTRMMRSLLFNVSPTDPVVFLTMALLLAAAALVAAYWPARLAARIPPSEALRLD
jgi:predicted permease